MKLLRLTVLLSCIHIVSANQKCPLRPRTVERSETIGDVYTKQEHGQAGSQMTQDVYKPPAPTAQPAQYAVVTSSTKSIPTDDVYQHHAVKSSIAPAKQDDKYATSAAAPASASPTPNQSGSAYNQGTQLKAQGNSYSGKIWRPDYCQNMNSDDPFKGVNFEFKEASGFIKNGVEEKDATPANKAKMLKIIKENNVPESWIPLFFASSMMETSTLCECEYDSSKDNMPGAKNFGPFNLNESLREELAKGEPSLKDDNYGVKVFKAALEQYGLLCALNYIRGGGTLFKENTESRRQEFKADMFFHAIYSIYMKIKADPSLLTDKRRLWYDIHHV